MRELAVALGLLGVTLILTAYVERGNHLTRREANEVFSNCMADFPGPWQTSAEWSSRCLKIAFALSDPGSGRAWQDYYRSLGRRAERPRRCIENPCIEDSIAEAAE